MLNIVLFLLKWICENHAEINNIRFCNQLKYAFFFFFKWEYARKYNEGTVRFSNQGVHRHVWANFWPTFYFNQQIKII